MAYCFSDKVCNIDNTMVLENSITYDKCKIEIRRCQKCNGFWKVKYRDSGNIYLRVEEMDGEFPCTFFPYTEVKKYGFKIPCGSSMELMAYKGLTCDFDNLEVIEILDKCNVIGYKSEVSIKICKECKQIWNTYYHFDSHHGGFTVCLKPGESFDYNETGSFTLEEEEKYHKKTQK